MEEATFLTRFANSVTVVHRRASLRASRVMSARAKANPKIRFVWNSQIASIRGGDTVSGLALRDTVTGEAHDIEVQGLFIAIGHDPRSELLRDQVGLSNEGYVLTRAGSTRTNVDGVFACGDVVDHIYRQAITAAGSGCQAAIDSERFLAQLPRFGELDVRHSADAS